MMVDAVLRSIGAERRRMREIIAEVSQTSGVSIAELRSPARHRRIAWPRQAAMLLMYEAGHTLPEIAEYLHRDHTTILHGIKRARQRADAVEVQQ
jgi:chromosomal replication initiation ATPase DnaA